MAGARTLVGLLVLGVVAIGAFQRSAAAHYKPFHPPLGITLSSPVSTLSDFVGISLGFRRLMADIAWVQTLVYYGTDEETANEETGDNGGGNYPLFLAHCQRTAHIDPSFKYVYYYGAGVLGWNLNRLDEAEALLKEGIQVHPKEWRFQQFLGALAFQKDHNVKKLAEFLEAFVDEKDCPNLLRSILANIYKKEHEYKKALQVWILIHQTGDPMYLERSESQIRELAPMAIQRGLKAH